jgi:hypothetical protein
VRACIFLTDIEKVHNLYVVSEKVQCHVFTYTSHINFPYGTLMGDNAVAIQNVL